MKTALVVDTDLGFLFWLAGVLVTAGYQAYPAENVTDAELILSKIQHGIELLIVNPLLPRADSFVSFVGNGPHPPVILALEPEPGAPRPELSGVTAWLPKPNPGDEASTSNWREALLSQLAEGGDSESFLWQ